MNRLTAAEYIGTYFIKDIYCKLRKLEDIEEELGCPLEVVFKALKQMVIFHKENVKIEILFLNIKSNDFYLYGFVEDTTQAVHLSLKDYGKTWTLTKEEWLEHDSQTND